MKIGKYWAGKMRAWLDAGKKRTVCAPPVTLSSRLALNLQKIRADFAESSDLIIREVDVGGRAAALVSIEGMILLQSFAQGMLNPVLQHDYRDCTAEAQYAQMRDAVIALAEEVLPRERGEEIARCYGEEEDDAAAQKETVTQMEVALPQFLVGFKCETNEGDLLRQSLIGEMASDVLLGDSSPLYQRLYDEGLINSSFGGGFDQLPGVAVLCAGGESGQPQQVSDAILEEAQRLAREGIDPDFFEQIRRASFGATLRALNSFENIAISMADGYFRGFDALRFPEAYASIEKADVERFLRENLTDSRRAISIIEPKKEG